MTENHENDHDTAKQVKAETEKDQQGQENGSDIIELSDIAIGITPEDDAIVELTEEIIGEAFVGFSGATSENIHVDERRLDLSETRSDIAASSDHAYGGRADESRSLDAVSEPGDMEDDNLEEDITKELDNYFGTDEDSPEIEETTLIGTPEPAPAQETVSEPADEQPLQINEISITARQLDDAIERVIRKMFAEKINRILDEISERTVTEEISQLKDYLLGISVKK